MNVLSLFDGMSCGRIALERAGVPVANYFASEIDKHARIRKTNRSLRTATWFQGNTVECAG